FTGNVLDYSGNKTPVSIVGNSKKLKQGTGFEGYGQYLKFNLGLLSDCTVLVGITSLPTTSGGQYIFYVPDHALQLYNSTPGYGLSIRVGSTWTNTGLTPALDLAFTHTETPTPATKLYNDGLYLATQPNF